MIEHINPLGIIEFEKILPMVHNKGGVVSFLHFLLQLRVFDKDDFKICYKLFGKSHTLG